MDASTKDPENGRIERDDRGEPAGTLRESAMSLVARHVPRPVPALRLEGLRLALGQLNGAGVTAVQEASASRAYLETYRDAEKSKGLTARVTVALRTDDGRGPEQVDDLARMRTEFASARVPPVAAKIFADGVIEGRTAAMIEPYLDRPAFRGEPNLSRDKLTALVRRLAGAGFNVHVHAIGDRAIRETLDAMEAARPEATGRDLRFQIAHAQLIRPEEVIDLPEALAAYTIGAAYAMGLEKETGSIELGKRADLVVLEKNLFDVPSRQLGKTRVLMTLLDGEPVYQDSSASGP